MNLSKIFKRKLKLNENCMDSLIGPNMSIKGGTVTYHGSLVVEGYIAAIIQASDDVKTSHTIIVGKTGIINTSDLIADFVVVRGSVTGNVTAKVQLIVESSGKINGDVTYGMISVAAGGSIIGRMYRYDAETPAVEAQA